jgi:hypothetical protein
VLPEVLVMKALLAVVLLEAGAWLLPRPSLRTVANGAATWANAPLGLAAMLLLTSQTMPVDSSAGHGKSLTFSVGARQSAYDEADNIGCGEPPEVYNHRAQLVSAEVAYRFNEKTSGAVTTVGMGAGGGSDHIRVDVRDDYATPTGYSPDTSFRSPLFHVNFFFAGERVGQRHGEFGYRVGLHVGQLYNTPSTDAAVTTFGRLAPDLMFWYGRRQRLFGQVDAGYGTNVLAPYTMSLGVGSGFGLRQGNLLAGVAVTPFTTTYYHSPTMAFASARIYLPSTGFIIEPYAAFNFDHYHQVSLRLHCRLALKNPANSLL